MTLKSQVFLIFRYTTRKGSKLIHFFKENDNMVEKNLANQSVAEDKHLEENLSGKHFTEPKLTFIEPKLTKHGDATEITAGFAGGFSP